MERKNFLTTLKRLFWVPEVFFAIGIILIILALLYIFDNYDFIQIQLPQVMLDVAVFGVLIVIFNRVMERRRDIKRWQEEIEDYREWKEPEATHRIVGNIRRLNRQGISKINLNNSYLADANLGGLDLRNASLSFADLHGAFLSDTKFQGAILGYTDLRQTWLLTPKQLSTVKTLFKAKLDPDLEKEMREKYPHLFEEPKYGGEGGGGLDR